MGKSEKFAFVIVTALLVILLGFIVIRTVTGPNAVRVYRVSILTDDVQGDYSANVLKGLDRAARDYNIDLQVINETGQPVQAEARQRPDGGIDVLLRSVEAAMGERVAAGQGAVYQAMRARFAVSDALV